MRGLRRLVAVVVAFFLPLTSGYAASPLSQFFNPQGGSSFQLPRWIPAPLQQQTEQAALQAAYVAVGKALGDDLPVTLDARTVLPPVMPPANFKPVVIACTPSNAGMPLPPGDYTCEVRAYCMMDSVHRPGSGVPYELAPLQGKQADAIATLVERGAAAGVPPPTLQVISWSIQASVPLSQMPGQNRQVVHQLIPDYERGLQGDFLQQIEAAYSSVAAIAHLPPFDTMLDRMGPAGRTIQHIRRSREIIRQNASSYERLSQQLYDGPPGQEVVRPTVPQPSPWSQIRPRVIAQFVVEQGNLGLNRLNFRVLSQRQPQLGFKEEVASVTSVSFISRNQDATYDLAQLSVENVLTIADVFGMAATSETGVGPELFAGDLARRRARNALIGYSQNIAAQALLMAMNSNGSGSNQQNNPPPRPQEKFPNNNLPTAGRRYVPPKQAGNPGVVKGQDGPVDVDGNDWEWARDQHGGPHWDVQHPDGTHTNVTPEGTIIGKDNFPNRIR